MWIIIEKNKVIKSPKGVTIDGIQHPKEIFRSWSIDELKVIGIKFFTEESYDSFKYRSTGYTDNDTGNEIIRTHILVENERYLDQLKEQKINQMNAELDNQILAGLDCTASVGVIRMDTDEFDGIRLKQAIEAAEEENETIMDIIDHNNDLHEEVPIDDVKAIHKLIRKNFKNIFKRKCKARKNIKKAKTEEDILAVTW